MIPSKIDVVNERIKLNNKAHQKPCTWKPVTILAASIIINAFITNKLSPTLPQVSYQPGIKSAPLHELLPQEIGKRLQLGFIEFGKKMRGYLSNDAVIVGVESRTSSPIRIPREVDSLQHPQIKGLYPCGEGAADTIPPA